MHEVFKREYLEKKYESEYTGYTEGREIYKDVWEPYLISRPAWAFEQWLIMSGYVEAASDICPVEKGIIFGAESPWDLTDAFIQFFPEYEEFEDDIKNHSSNGSSAFF